MYISSINRRFFLCRKIFVQLPCHCFGINFTSTRSCDKIFKHRGHKHVHTVPTWHSSSFMAHQRRPRNQKIPYNVPVIRLRCFYKFTTNRDMWPLTCRESKESSSPKFNYICWTLRYSFRVILPQGPPRLICRQRIKLVCRGRVTAIDLEYVAPQGDCSFPIPRQLHVG